MALHSISLNPMSSSARRPTIHPSSHHALVSIHDGYGTGYASSHTESKTGTGLAEGHNLMGAGEYWIFS